MLHQIISLAFDFQLSFQDVLLSYLMSCEPTRKQIDEMARKPSVTILGHTLLISSLHRTNIDKNLQFDSKTYYQS